MSNIVNTIKKHKKPLMIAGGILAALYVLRGASAAAARPATSTMPIGPTLHELKAIGGPLGSLE